MSDQTAQEYFDEGEKHLRAGRYLEAIECFTQAIELKPDYAEAYNLRGYAKYCLQQYEEAIQDYNQSIQLNSTTNFEAFKNRGIAKNALGRYEEAIIDLSRAIEIMAYPDMYLHRGIAKNELGRYEEAIIDFDRAIGLQADYANAYFNRGIAKNKLGRYEGAIIDLDRAIRLQPNAEAYNNRGIAKNELKQYGKAIRDFNQAIEFHPNYAEAYFNRGIAKNELKEYGEAIIDLDRAIELKPNYAEAYFNRGKTKKNLGDDSGALDDFKRSQELDPYLIVSESAKEGQREVKLELDKAKKDIREAKNFQRILEEAQKGYGKMSRMWLMISLLTTAVVLFLLAHIVFGLKIPCIPPLIFGLKIPCIPPLTIKNTEHFPLGLITFHLLLAGLVSFITRQYVVAKRLWLETENRLIASKLLLNIQNSETDPGIKTDPEIKRLAYPQLISAIVNQKEPGKTDSTTETGEVLEKLKKIIELLRE